MIDFALVSAFVAFTFLLLGFWVVVVERFVMSLLGARASDEQARFALRIATAGAAMSAVVFGVPLLVALATQGFYASPPLVRVLVIPLTLAPALGLLAARVRPSIGRWLVVGMIGMNLPVVFTGLVGGFFLLPTIGAAAAILFGARGTRIGSPAL